MRREQIFLPAKKIFFIFLFFFFPRANELLGKQFHRINLYKILRNRTCLNIILFRLQRRSPPSLVLSLSPGLGPDGLPSPGSGYHHHLAPTSFGSGSGGGSNGASADAVDGAGAIGGASAAGGASELMHQLALRSSTGKEKIHNKISNCGFSQHFGQTVF